MTLLHWKTSVHIGRERLFTIETPVAWGVWNRIDWYVGTNIVEQLPVFILSVVQYFDWSDFRKYTGLFEMFVGVLTTCHTQYTWDRSICVFYLIKQHSKFLLHTLHVLYIWTLCDFYKHQHDNRVRSKLFVAFQRWWFQWRFWFVPSVQRYLREEEEHKPVPWRNPIERNHMGLHLEKEVTSC